MSLSPTPTPPARLTAVIDVGTTSLRMAVAQIDGNGGIQILDTLQQSIAIGRDTFTRGLILPETTEAVVTALNSFRHVLNEYGIAPTDAIRAVATSAVREAANRDAFIDRVAIATGIAIDIIDESEVARYTYLAMHPVLHGDRALREGHVLAVEVGGGSTEVLVLRRGHVERSLSFRLGSLRLRRMIENDDAPTPRQMRLMEDQVERSVQSVRHGYSDRTAFRMLALGGDARFAARRLEAKHDRFQTACIELAALRALTADLLKRSLDAVVRRYGLSYPDAETMGPALLILVKLAEAFGVPSLRVGRSTLREGLLADIASEGPWNEHVKRQIVHSALEIGRGYRFDKAHAQRAADLARRLFQALADEHRLHPRYELILHVAALLHDIGLSVSNRSHHKHAHYLILNGDLFGVGPRDLQMIALIARYHRRSEPQPTHPEYMALSREQRVVVKQLAALLRIADALDRGHSIAVDQIAIRVEPTAVVVSVSGVGDLTVEQFAIEQKGDLFESVYGKALSLRAEHRRLPHDSWNVDGL